MVIKLARILSISTSISLWMPSECHPCKEIMWNLRWHWPSPRLPALQWACQTGTASATWTECISCQTMAASEQKKCTCSQSWPKKLTYHFLLVHGTANASIPTGREMGQALMGKLYFPSPNAVQYRMSVCWVLLAAKLYSNHYDLTEQILPIPGLMAGRNGTSTHSNKGY